MRNNIVKDKSFDFAVRIVRLYQFVCQQKKEYVMSKQLLRCGTAVGTMVREAEHAESRADFKHKLSLAQKEINESMYWLELLKKTDYLTTDQYMDIYGEVVEIIKLLTSILKTTKANING